jgi:hypothetical protein
MLEEIIQLDSKLNDLVSIYINHFKNEEYKECIDILEKIPFSLENVLIKKVGKQAITNTKELYILNRRNITRSDVISLLTMDKSYLFTLIHHKTIDNLMNDPKLVEYLDSNYSDDFRYLSWRNKIEPIYDTDELITLLYSMCDLLYQTQPTTKQLKDIAQFIMVNQHHDNRAEIKDLEIDIIQKLVIYDKFDLDISVVLSSFSFYS